jgi:hypothetical protein
MTAGELLALLKYRHVSDIFISECKDGGTWDRSTHRRMDAWTIRTSYSNPLTIAYEIKVSRSDFLADKKWQDYLPLCDEFYFVCPNGMIDPRELSPEAGLLWTTKKGDSLRIKKRPTRRKVVIPEKMYRYLLFSRCEIIDREKLKKQRSTKKFWEDWLINKKINSRFGENVSLGVAKKMKEKISDVEEKARLVKFENDRLTEIKELVESLGVDISSWDSVSQVEKKLKEKVGA